MKDLILYIILIIVGYFLGNRIDADERRNLWIARGQTAAIALLLFTMGMRMGANSDVTGNLKSIGFISAAMTLIIMFFSAAFAGIGRRCIGLDRKARPKGQTVTVSEELSAETDSQGDMLKEQKKMAVMIVISVSLGMVCGFFLIPGLFVGRMAEFDGYAGLAINFGLILLLLVIGYNMGQDGTVIENFKKVGARIIVFPFIVMTGAAAAAVVCKFLMGITLQESMAVAAGFGWYSLAPNIIFGAGLARCGAISFMHCIMREYFSLLLVPVVAKRVGYMEAIGICGATAMGVCLPIVERSTRGDVVIYSFISGFVHTAMVPILLPLIVG